jgi:hypothetical protein
VEVTQSPPLAVDTQEAARRLGVSPKTLEMLRCYRPEQSPKFFKLGRRVLYRISDLEAFAASLIVGGREGQSP